MNSRFLPVLVILVTLALILSAVGSLATAQDAGARASLASFAKRNVDSSFYVSHVYPADLDDDNDIDIIATGKMNYSDSYNTVVWYENDGNQSFTRQTLVEDDGSTLIMTADLNGDGNLDFLSPTSSTYWGLAWYQNDGSENFSRQVISNTYSSTDAYAADLDQDNDIDILTAGGRFSWWQNDGSGNFTHHLIQSGTSMRSANAADVDGDGYVDVISAEEYQVVWWENDGNSTPDFINKKTVPTTYQWPRGIIAGDVDADSDVDLIGVHAESGHDVAWWENDGYQQFTHHTIDSYFEFSWVVRAADLDNDGDQDIVCAASHGGLAWYENDGQDTFTKNLIIGSAYENVEQVEVIDVNKDGKLDLVSGRTGQVSGREVDWFENGLAAPGTVKQAHFRIGHDTPLSAMTWYEITDTAAANVPQETNFRARFQIYNDGGQPVNWRPQLEWSTSQSSGFAVVPTLSGSVPFYVADTDQFADGETISTPAFALGYGTGSAQAGVAYEGSNPPASAITLDNGFYTEVEFSVRANANAAYGMMYFFRLTNNGIPLTAYEVTSAAIEMAPDQGTVSGTVVDQTENVLSGVQVALDGLNQDTTDAHGDYGFTVSPGSYIIIFSRDGYWTVTDTLSVISQGSVSANAMLIPKSTCLSEDTSCALALVSLLPVVGSAAEIAQLGSVGNELCQVSELYTSGEYAQCAAKIALWIAQAARIPVISQLLELQQGANTVDCVLNRLDSVGQELGKVALAFWDYIESNSGRETVIVFQLQPGTQARHLSSLNTAGINFELTDAGGDVLSVSGGTTYERSIDGSFALVSDQGYAVGIVSQSSADFDLNFHGTISGRYDLDVILPQSDGSSLKMTYAGIYVTPETSGTLSIRSDAVDNDLALDTDGDGTVDQFAPPDAVEVSVRRVHLPVVLRGHTPGMGWSYDVRVDDATGASYQLYPDLADGPDGTLYAVWEDYRNGVYSSDEIRGDIYFAYSTNGGRSWANNLRVNDGGAADAARRKPSIAVSPSGDVYVVWEDWRNDPDPAHPGKTAEGAQNPDIYLAKLPAGATSFEPDVKVLDDPDRQFEPHVEIDGNGNIYVAWYDRRSDIYYGNAVVAKSSDGGANFSEPVIADVHSMWALRPRLAINRRDNHVYLVYQGHPGYYKPFFTYSTDGGITWSWDVELDAGPDRDWYDAARQIEVTADNSGHVLVIWADERNDPDNCYSGGSSCHDEFDIYANHSSDGGITWPVESNVMVNDDSGYAGIYAPDTTLAPNGTAVAVWRDSREGDGISDIYMATSSDYGASWSTNHRVDHAPSGYRADYPAVTVSRSGDVYVLWHDDRNGDWDIYFTGAGQP